MRELASVGFDAGQATAGSPEDLAAILGQARYDLAITQYAAPGWSWRAALEALRGCPQPPPLIVLAGDSDPRLLMNCVLEGAADCLHTGELFRLPISAKQILELQAARHHPGARDVVQADLRFRQIFEASPDAILQVDREGRIVLANSLAGEMFRCRLDDLLGKSVDEFVPTRFRDRHPGYREHYQAKPAMRPMGSGLDLWARRADGSEFPVDITLSPLDTKDGPQIMCVVRDMTDRRRIERDLHRQAQLIEASHDAIIVREPGGRILQWNAGAQEIYGWSAAEAIGQVSHALFQTVFPVSLEALEAEIDHSGKWDGELQHTRRDGARITVETRHILLGRTDGQAGALLEINRDITQRKRVEEAVGALNAKLGAANKELELRNREVERANRLKSEFLASMSHELRTPLNAIIGFSDLLAEQIAGALSSKQLRFVNHIQQGARHLLALINDILDLSKVEAGRMELELTRFDLPTALQDALILIRERAARHGVALGLDVDARVGPLVGDERKIKQVLLNLLSNAVKFTPEGGRIELRAVPTDHAVEISVTDTGIGIAPENQEIIFEEFRQAGGDYAHKREGTGLGLTLARKFVELHGGHIWVKSQPGQGSTFTFSLPERAWPAS